MTIDDWLLTEGGRERKDYIATVGRRSPPTVQEEGDCEWPPATYPVFKRWVIQAIKRHKLEGNAHPMRFVLKFKVRAYTEQGAQELVRSWRDQIREERIWT